MDHKVTQEESVFLARRAQSVLWEMKAPMEKLVTKDLLVQLVHKELREDEEEG